MPKQLQNFNNIFHNNTKLDKLNILIIINQQSRKIITSTIIEKQYHYHFSKISKLLDHKTFIIQYAQAKKNYQTPNYRTLKCSQIQ